MSAPITFDDVTLAYGKRRIFSNLSFEIRRGDFLGLVGPNGAGKTTILRALLGTLTPVRGEVRRAPDVRFGYVPQRDQLDTGFPLRVLDVVLMGRYARIGVGRRPSADDRRAAVTALEHAGIADLAARPFADLSGGQKQRTLIARALAGEPNVLVLDEPTRGMDLASTTQMLELARELHARERLTVIMVSHALNEVANCVERIALVLPTGFHIGPVDEVLTEESLRGIYGIPVEVAHFNGHRVVLARPHAVVGYDPDGATSPTADDS